MSRHRAAVVDIRSSTERFIANINALNRAIGRPVPWSSRSWWASSKRGDRS